MLKKSFSLALAALLCFGVVGAVGCAEEDTLVAEGVAVPCFTGEEGEKEYDSSVFYRNDLTIFGGDSDVLWVPEERDPVYGGYFYQYTSGNGGVYTPDNWQSGTADTMYGVSCLRSKDLNDWELCGAVDDGFAVEFHKGEWAEDYIWAPEAEYDEKTQKYYMYFSSQPLNGRYFYIGVYSSESPVGPFRAVTSESMYGDKNAPDPNGNIITAQKNSIDIEGHFGLNYPWAAIDPSPFIDEDGTLYLYFSKEYATHPVQSTEELSIWVMRMKDFATPDYDSLRMVSFPGYKSVRYIEGKPIWENDSYEKIPYGPNENPDDDGTINEGAQMLTHTGADGVKRYYLTYSQWGFAARDYGVHQAVSTSPYGPFVKIGREKSAMAVNATNDYMTGVGHHAYVEREGELYCVYWVHADPFDTSTAQYNGRAYAFDKTVYVYDEALGFDILYGNGPSKSLQPLPTFVTGLRNVATEATVSATKEIGGSAKWVNDGCFTVVEAFSERELKTEGKTVITLTFDEPKEIRGIMIYNSYHYNYAFSSIDTIVFSLAEKPSWFPESLNTSKAFIENLAFSKDYYNAEDKFMRQGGSAHASFNAMKVTEIKIGISQKLNGAAGEEIRVSDIVVLGK